MSGVFATLSVEFPGRLSVARTGRSGTEDLILDQVRELNRFLAGIERRAFRIARIALRNDDDALDAVQDAMLKLARSYAQRPSAEWPPLFYRILQNRIRDGQRRRQVRNRFFAWLPGTADDENDIDPVEAAPADGVGAVEQLMANEAIAKLEHSIARLPARQQEAFMLRNLEGLDVAQTAAAMGCSEGSVKTHYSRAVHTLRAELGDTW
ncbi:MAG TPA: RNA polymerase sigma factor [Povalibacter sp.]